MKKLLAGITLSLALSAQAATPTFAQVNSAIEAGHLPEARVMMNEVLRKRPESVKAHSINATLLAAEGKSLAEVRSELALANNIKSNVEIISEEKPLKYFVLALCGLAGIITAFLSWQFMSIKGRKKQKPITPKGEINETNVQETDSGLYSVALSTHSISKPIA